jgi:hypothetical protein
MSDQTRKSPTAELHEHQHSTQKNSSESNSANLTLITNSSSNENLKNSTKVSFSNNDSHNSSDLDKTLTNEVNNVQSQNDNTADNFSAEHESELPNSPVPQARAVFPKPNFKPLTKVQNSHHSGSIQTGDRSTHRRHARD